ncbi:Clavata3/esr-related 14, putative [Theobroma cacao]|uniref:Clavata3/esr-related 14, putative n=1 Tax=Theobroma cacao TaxID=3641 RepID=A0A061G1X6_THECC|nr:Clavata3/esr-related 14, putative [Theobroma cacao]
MRTQNSLFLFLTFFIILGLIRVTSCRYISQATSKETDQRLRDKYSPMFYSSFSAIHILGKPAGTKKFSSVHAVSHRLVPDGPNPLHN